MTTDDGVPVATIWTALEQSAVGAFVRESTYAYPALETVHIIGIALVFGGIALFDLRVLGLNRDLPVRRLAALILPWVWVGFAMNAVSGILLFVSNAVEFSGNPALQAKLALIAVAGMNAWAFHRQAWQTVAAWNTDVRAPLAPRVFAISSLVIWLLILSAGRMIAYVA
jgi:hypothetical protein